MSEHRVVYSVIRANVEIMPIMLTNAGPTSKTEKSGARTPRGTHRVALAIPTLGIFPLKPAVYLFGESANSGAKMRIVHRLDTALGVC